MESIDYKRMGAAIRAERRNRKLTQEKLAAMAEISTSYLGHIERGSRKMSLETAFTIACILDLPMDAIMGTRFEYIHYDIKNDTLQILLQAVLQVLRDANIQF